MTDTSLDGVRENLERELKVRVLILENFDASIQVLFHSNHDCCDPTQEQWEEAFEEYLPMCIYAHHLSAVELIKGDAMASALSNERKNMILNHHKVKKILTAASVIILILLCYIGFLQFQIGQPTPVVLPEAPRAPLVEPEIIYLPPDVPIRAEPVKIDPVRSLPVSVRAPAPRPITVIVTAPPVTWHHPHRARAMRCGFREPRTLREIGNHFGHPDNETKLIMRMLDPEM